MEQKNIASRNDHPSERQAARVESISCLTTPRNLGRLRYSRDGSATCRGCAAQKQTHSMEQKKSSPAGTIACRWMNSRTPSKDGAALLF